MAGRQHPFWEGPTISADDRCCFCQRLPAFPGRRRGAGVAARCRQLDAAEQLYRDCLENPPRGMRHIEAEIYSGLLRVLQQAHKYDAIIEICRKGIKEDLQKNFGFSPDFENAKYQLEKGDGSGNTFKATAKPVLIGTAVVGATTMVFGIIILLENLFGGVVGKLSLVQPEIILGLLMGGSVIYWFTGASTQAVVTGAYRAVVYIKENMKLDATTASEKDSKEVVRICTVYAQKGMWNIFIVIFCLALALAFFNPYFFIAATVVGDTVGDPFKDTSSVAMNPVIKFTTLFGLLATEIAVTMPETQKALKTCIGAFFFAVALVFVYRSFYAMRIPEEKTGTEDVLVIPHNVHGAARVPANPK